MPTDGRPLKRPLIQNFVVSSEAVKKTSKKSDPLFSSFIVPLLVGDEKVEGSKGRRGEGIELPKAGGEGR